ncbi:MAG: substrate-binding domain-containing protein [Puniceicoccaceae bacterium]
MKLSLGVGMDNPMRVVGYFLRAPMRLAYKSNFFSHVAQGLHEYLREKKVNMVFLGSEVDIDPRELRRSSWRKMPLEGIVMMGEVQPDFLSAVRELDRPLVYVSARSPGICHSVNANEYQAAEYLVDHLYELGHRHFAYFGSLQARMGNDERLAGLRLALSRHELELPESAVLTLDEAERKQGYQMVEMLLRSPPKPFPTAIVCGNGLLGRGVLGRLFEEGFKAGRDVSVVAFDNTRVCSEELPGITSASSMPEELGRESGRILLDPNLHGGDSLLDVVLPSKFFFRESSGPVASSSAKHVRSILKGN